MAEPLSSGLAAIAVGVVSGIAINGLHLPHDSGVLAGIVCGSATYLVRAREPSRWHKAVYFSVSLAGGYYLSSWVLEEHPHFSGWLTGFMTSASIVTVAALSLDWLERNVQPTLDRIRTWALDRRLGGKTDDDA